MNIPGDEFYILILDTLKKRGAETLQRALYLALREAILHGRLQAESRLPGSRVIARQLGLSRNTVNAALEQLTLEGYLLRNRQGTRVAQLAKRNIAHPSPEPVVTLAKRVSLFPAPTPRERRFLHLRRERPPLTIFLCHYGGVYTTGYCGRRAVPCWAMAIPQGSCPCARPLPGTCVITRDHLRCQPDCHHRRRTRRR
jgi:biotin operon repressor